MGKALRDHDQPSVSITKLITDLAHRHNTWQTFSDFVEMGAISISNAIDVRQRETREANYLAIVQRYRKDEIEQFPKMLGELVLGLEAGPDDILGSVFHRLELHNKWVGQYFTPFPLCQMMAKIQICDGQANEIIERRGFITAIEPASGSGAMVIALAEALHGENINYQQKLHVTAVDVDLKAVHMAYLQLSLLHIPAVVVHGNSLSTEEFSRWYTPAHILGGWDYKLKRATKPSPESVPLVPANTDHEPEPSRPEPASPKLQPTQLKLF